MFKGSEFINKTLIIDKKKKKQKLIVIVTLFEICLKDFETVAWAYIIETYDLVKNHKI